MWSSTKKEPVEAPDPEDDKNEGTEINKKKDRKKTGIRFQLRPFTYRANFNSQPNTEIFSKLEPKMGQHNFMEDDETEEDNVYTKARKSFRSFLEPKRISSRPIAIIRKSDEDILRLQDGSLDTDKQGKDELLAIPILPADEMDALTVEIKLWNKNRKKFKFVFGAALASGVLLLLVSLVFTMVWYAEPVIFKSASNFHRTGSLYFNAHMCGQVTNMCVMVFGLMIFRLLPHVRLTKVIAIHGFVFAISTILSVISTYLPILYQDLYTNQHSHFYSLHSWIGIIVMLLYSASLITGVLILYYPSNAIRKLHSPFSVLSFMLFGACSISGYFARALIQLGVSYKTVTLPGIMTNCCGVLILLLCVFVRIGVANFVFRRRARPYWDVVVFRSLEVIEDSFLDVHEEYDTFENWVGDVNHTRLRALRVPHAVVKGH